KKKSGIYEEEEMGKKAKVKEECAAERGIANDYEMGHQAQLVEDLIREILVRLPPKSLYRFRSVCKTWLDAISHPDFTRDHLSRVCSESKDSHGHNHICLFHPFWRAPSLLYEERSECCTNLDDETEEETIIQMRTMPLPLELNNEQTKLQLSGSCDGLVLIIFHRPMDDDACVIISNPSTREFKRIDIPLPESAADDAWGIGYDHLNCCYKLVRAPFLRDDSPVQVFSLKTNSWKTTASFDDFLYRTRCSDPVTANRCPHWKASYRKTKQIHIIYFDPSQEDFRVVPLPNEAKDFLGVGHPTGLLGTLDIFGVGGSLGLCLNNHGHQVSLWSMQEHGVRESWVKLYTVMSNTPTSDLVLTTPWCIIKDKKILFRVEEKNAFYSYDVKTKMFRKVDIPVIRNFSRWCSDRNRTPYIETLLSPHHSIIIASINNVTFVMPTTALLQAHFFNISGVFTTDFPAKPPHVFNYTGSGPANLQTRKGTKVYRLKYNSTVQLVLQDTGIISPENHPVHLHGFNFFAVGRGIGNCNPKQDSKKFNLADPKYTHGDLKWHSWWMMAKALMSHFCHPQKIFQNVKPNTGCVRRVTEEKNQHIRKMRRTRCWLPINRTLSPLRENIKFVLKPFVLCSLKIKLLTSSIGLQASHKGFGDHNEVFDYKMAHQTELMLEDRMIQEILVRLPLKSIVRFSSLSKTWKDTINYPDFIWSHIQQWNAPSNKFFFALKKKPTECSAVI
ncbi:hypothetical protein Tsubulata_028490, partial [Turnera subulata]